MSKAKVLIQRYDPSVTEAPFKFIDLGETEVEETENDYLGKIRARRMREACEGKGFTFRFYSLSCKDDYKYTATVY